MFSIIRTLFQLVVSEGVVVDEVDCEVNDGYKDDGVVDGGNWSYIYSLTDLAQICSILSNLCAISSFDKTSIFVSSLIVLLFSVIMVIFQSVSRPMLCKKYLAGSALINLVYARKLNAITIQNNVVLTTLRRDIIMSVWWIKYY